MASMAYTLDKIFDVFKGVTTRTSKYKTGQKIGYNDIKDYLDRFLGNFDKSGSGVEGIVLYGSMARGEAHSRSDIDILFITKNTYKTYNEIYHAQESISPKEYANLLYKRGINTYLSPKIWNLGEIYEFAKLESEHGGLIHNIADDGVILYDSDGQITKYIEKLRKEPHEKHMWIP